VAHKSEVADIINGNVFHFPLLCAQRAQLFGSWLLVDRGPIPSISNSLTFSKPSTINRGNAPSRLPHPHGIEAGSIQNTHGFSAFQIISMICFVFAGFGGLQSGRGLSIVSALHEKRDIQIGTDGAGGVV